MATITKTASISVGFSGSGTATVVFSYPDSVKINSEGLNASSVLATKATCKVSLSGYTPKTANATINNNVDAYNDTTSIKTIGTQKFSIANTSWGQNVTKTLQRSYTGTTNVSTSELFNDTNKDRAFILVGCSGIGGSINVSGTTTDGTSFSTLLGSYGNIKVPVYLNVPPTFSNDAIEFDTNFDAPYAGLTTASVKIRSLTAYYDGYITKATLTIGNQTDTLTFTESGQPASTETLDIPLGAVGTFTPTITVTDSRGQTKTVSLEAITVKGYSAPQVSINEVLRTDENGLGNDEGKCAVVTATFTWTSAITDLDEPVLVATELDDTLVQTETKWYTDRALQNEITDWSEVSNMPVYGFIGNSNTPPDPFDTQDSYNITITPNDEQGTGTPVTATLGSAFYTVDFLAGGHGIAFGKPAETQELFECDLNAQFNKQVLAPNYFTQLDTTEPPDTTTTDGQIYQALKDLGWTDVIV